MDEILYLEPDEEITSIVDKLKGLDSASVGLVAPRGSSIVQSLVSLKLLKKQAEKLKKEIAIITTDEVGQNLASRIDLPVYETPKSKSPLKQAEEEVPSSREPIEIDMNEDPKPKTDFEVHRYDEQVSPNQEQVSKEQVPKESFVHKKITQNQVTDKPERSKESSKWKKILFIALPLLLILLLGFSSLALSRLDIAMAIPAEEIQRNIKMTIEKDRSQLDLKSATIPGKQLQEERGIEDIYKATGEKNVGEKATGSLTFKNEAGVDETIQSGATIVSTAGREYVLTETISVPKATLNSAGDKVLGQKTGAVEAKEPGEQFNISEATFTVYGKSLLSVTGSVSGGVTKTVTIVTEQDINEAKESLTEKAKIDLQEALKSANKDYEIVPDASKLEIDEFSSSREANEEATEFKLSAKANYLALGYVKSEFNEVAYNQVSTLLIAEEDPKGLLETDSDQFEIKVNSGDISSGKIDLEVSVLTHAGPEIDFSKMKREWKGKPLEKVRSDLKEIEGAQIKSVNLVPNFALPYAPLLSQRINVAVEYINQ